MSFKCPVCHRVSYNPNDESAGYCGNCHAFTGTPNYEPYNRRPDGQQRFSSRSPKTRPESEVQLSETDEDGKTK